MAQGYRTKTKLTDPAWTIRLPKEMKEGLEKRAKNNGRSLNAEISIYCKIMLENKVRINALNQVFVGDQSY